MDRTPKLESNDLQIQDDLSTLQPGLADLAPPKWAPGQDPVEDAVRASSWAG